MEKKMEKKPELFSPVYGGERERIYCPVCGGEMEQRPGDEALVCPDGHIFSLRELGFEL